MVKMGLEAAALVARGQNRVTAQTVLSVRYQNDISNGLLGLESELNWRIESRDGVRVISPAGRVDETIATGFADRLIDEVAAAAAAGAQRLAIDLAGVTYLSSRGLRALTLAQRKAKELEIAVVLAKPNTYMREILAITRYDKLFTVDERLEDAICS